MCVSVCIHAYVYAHYVSAHTYMCLCVWRPYVDWCQHVLLSPSSHQFFNIESLTRPELTSSTRLLTSQWGPGILLSLFPRDWTTDEHPGLHIGPGDPNSSPHVCAANTFLTEPYFPSQHLLLSLHNKLPHINNIFVFERTREWMNDHFRPVVTYMAVVAFALILWKQSILKHVLQIQ